MTADGQQEASSEKQGVVTCNYAFQMQNRTKAFEEMHLWVLEATYQVVVLRWCAGRDRRAAEWPGVGPPGGDGEGGGTAGVRRPGGVVGPVLSWELALP